MIAALGFLTVLPVRGRLHGAETRMLLAFPFVGGLIGAVWTVTGWGAEQAVPAITVAAIVLFVDLVLTGALHLDAVGDVGDGFAARRAGGDPTTAMKDPRIGSVGAATLGAVVLLRFGLLVAVLEVGPWLAMLWLVPVLGRSGMTLALWVSPPRQDSIASTLTDAATLPIALVAALAGVVAGAIAVVLGAPPVAVTVAVLAAPAAAVGLTRLGIAAFGRPSGDLVGASGIAAETVALLALALAPVLDPSWAAS